jgi:hypothetical protein
VLASNWPRGEEMAVQDGEDGWTPGDAARNLATRAGVLIKIIINRHGKFGFRSWRSCVFFCVTASRRLKLPDGKTCRSRSPSRWLG